MCVLENMSIFLKVLSIFQNESALFNTEQIKRGKYENSYFS